MTYDINNMITLIGLTLLIAIGLYFKTHQEYPTNTQPRKSNGQYTNRVKRAQLVTVNDIRESCGLDRGY